MSITLVHQALLLVDQLFLELLLPDLLLFHLSSDLLLNSSLLSLSAARPSLLLVRVLSEQRLILLFLPGDAVHCLLILMRLLGLLLLRRVSELGEADLGLGNVLRQDVVNVAVLFLLLALHFLLPAALQDRLKLFLLHQTELVSILQQFNELLFSKLTVGACTLHIHLLLLAIILLNNRLAILVYHEDFLVLLLLLDLLLVHE